MTYSVPQQAQQGGPVQKQLQAQHWGQSTVKEGSMPSLPPGYRVIAVPPGFQGKQQVLTLQPAQGTFGQHFAMFTHSSAPSMLQQVQGPHAVQLQPQLQVVRLTPAAMPSPKSSPSHCQACLCLQQQECACLVLEHCKGYTFAPFSASELSFKLGDQLCRARPC